MVYEVFNLIAFVASDIATESQVLWEVDFLSMYDYLIVTHIPVFYKVNLYRALAKKMKIYVIFLASDTSEKRGDDFICLDNINFDYEVLYNGDFQCRNKVKNIMRLRVVLKQTKLKKMILSGWDLLEFWFLAAVSNKNKSCLALESTVVESGYDGFKGKIKQLFLSKISKVFASGKLHVELLEKLGYSGNIVTTKGVGIINKPELEKVKKKYQKRFLFIGRLSHVKNLEVLIKVFNQLPDYTLTLVGDGEGQGGLKEISNGNIVFLAPVKNNAIQALFNKQDVFVLPSISETWGLVIEEALYFGVPVVVSKNCGACELIEHGKNGYVIAPEDSKGIKAAILNFSDERLVEMMDYIAKHSLLSKDNNQVSLYE